MNKRFIFALLTSCFLNGCSLIGSTPQNQDQIVPANAQQQNLSNLSQLEKAELYNSIHSDTAVQRIANSLLSSNLSEEQMQLLRCSNETRKGNFQSLENFRNIFNDCLSKNDKESLLNAIKLLNSLRIFKSDFRKLSLGNEYVTVDSHNNPCYAIDLPEYPSTVPLSSSPEVLRYFLKNLNPQQIQNLLSKLIEVITSKKIIYSDYSNSPNERDLLCQIIVALCTVPSTDPTAPKIPFKTIMNLNQNQIQQLQHRDESGQLVPFRQSEDFLLNLLHEAQRDLILYRLAQSEGATGFADVVGEVIKIINEGLEANGSTALSPEESLNAVFQQFHAWFDNTDYDETGYHLSDVSILHSTLRTRYLGTTGPLLLMKTLNFLEGLYLNLSQGTKSLIEDECFKTAYDLFMKDGSVDRLKAIEYQLQAQKRNQDFVPAIKAERSFLLEQYDPKSSDQFSAISEQISILARAILNGFNDIAENTRTNQQYDLIEFCKIFQATGTTPFLQQIFNRTISNTRFQQILDTYQNTVCGNQDNINIEMQKLLNIFIQYDSDLDPSFRDDILNLAFSDPTYTDWQRGMMRILSPDLGRLGLNLSTTRYAIAKKDFNKVPVGLTKVLEDYEGKAYAKERLFLFFSVLANSNFGNDLEINNPIAQDAVWWRLPAPLFKNFVESLQAISQSKKTGYRYLYRMHDLSIQHGFGHFTSLIESMIATRLVDQIPNHVSHKAQKVFSVDYKSGGTTADCRNGILTTYSTPVTQHLDSALDRTLTMIEGIRNRSVDRQTIELWVTEINETLGTVVTLDEFSSLQATAPARLQTASAYNKHGYKASGSAFSGETIKNNTLKAMREFSVIFPLFIHNVLSSIPSNDEDLQPLKLWLDTIDVKGALQSFKRNLSNRFETFAAAVKKDEGNPYNLSRIIKDFLTEISNSEKFGELKLTAPQDLNKVLALPSPLPTLTDQTHE